MRSPAGAVRPATWGSPARRLPRPRPCSTTGTRSSWSPDWQPRGVTWAWPSSRTARPARSHRLLPASPPIGAGSRKAHQQPRQRLEATRPTGPGSGLLHQQELDLNPEYAEAHMNQGGLCSGPAGRLRRGRGLLRRGPRSKPDLVEAYANLGSVLFALGKYAEAEPCLQRMLARKSRHPETQGISATLYDFCKGISPEGGPTTSAAGKWSHSTASTASSLSPRGMVAR